MKKTLYTPKECHIIDQEKLAEDVSIIFLQSITIVTWSQDYEKT